MFFTTAMAPAVNATTENKKEATTGGRRKGLLLKSCREARKLICGRACHLLLYEYESPTDRAG